MVWSQRTKRGLQLAPLALLLLHDQGYKGWCHDGHGTSYNRNIMRSDPCLAPMADGDAAAPMAAKANFLQEILPVKTFPKGCHLFGGDGRQAETTTIAELQFSSPHKPPLTYGTNSSLRR